jgi:hypothetical protein
MEPGAPPDSARKMGYAVHCIVFIFKYKMPWRLCIVLGTQYNKIHSKKMY